MADVGYGTTIAFQSSIIAELLSVNLDGWERNEIDTSHMTSTNSYMTFMPNDLKNPGEMTCEMLFNPNLNWKTALAAAAETITVTFPIPSGGSAGATWACSGFLKSVSKVVPHDDRMLVTAVIKFSGEPTEADSS